MTSWLSHPAWAARAGPRSQPFPTSSWWVGDHGVESGAAEHLVGLAVADSNQVVPAPAMDPVGAGLGASTCASAEITSLPRSPSGRSLPWDWSCGPFNTTAAD